MATNLIVMATDGRNGFLDALRGSHSERVLRRTPCPLLAIPAEAAVADASDQAALQELDIASFNLGGSQ
jgi:hypothetical protein